MLDKTSTAHGLGEILYGPELALQCGVGGDEPCEGARTPDTFVTPNLVSSTSGGNIEDLGGFSHDDTNVMLLVANPAVRAQTVVDGRTIAQLTPTFLQSLGLT